MIPKAEIDERLRAVAEAKSEIEVLALFGSFARGDTHAASDIDIAVQGGDIERLRVDLMRELQTERIDLIDMRRAPPLLAMTIAKDGRVLFEKTPGVFNAFVSLAFRRYCDTAKFREHRRAALRDFVDKQQVR